MSSRAAAASRKIVFVNRYFFPDQSATSQMLSDLAFGLAGRGFAVHVVCSRQRYERADANLTALERVRGVTVHRVWTTRFGRDHLAGRAIDYASFYVSSAARLLLLVSSGDTLVAETDPPLISLVAAAVAVLKRARLVNWLHDVFPEIATLLDANPLPEWVDAGLRRLRDLSLRVASMNVVLGVRMQELLGRRVAPSKLCIIENWAAAEAAAEQRTPSELRARLGLNGKFVVGYSGNLGRAHEFATLLEAASLCRADPDIVFLMIGAGAGMAALQQAVRDRGLPNFKFLPLQPRASLSDTLAAADVHWLSLLPVLEGLIVPSKLYGILASGRPMLFIGDPDGEVARVIEAAGAGVGVAIGQAAELARHIADLKCDPRRRATLGENAVRLYQERYTGQRALDRWTQLLATQTGDSS
jgi:glycosyltransferase involved in cell wall biosynthesis